MHEVGFPRRGISVVAALAMVAALIMAVSTVLPCQTIAVPLTDLSVSRNMMDGWEGKVVMVLAVITAVCSLMRVYAVPLAAGALGMIVFIFENIGVDQKLSELPDWAGWAGSLIKTAVHFGPGYYMLLISSIVLAVSGVLGFIEKGRRR